MSYLQLRHEGHDEGIPKPVLSYKPPDAQAAASSGGWYRFVDLSSEEKHHRRELLDYYGFVAQVSVIVPILVLLAYTWTSRIARRFATPATSEAPPSSPYAKAARLGNGLDAGARWRQVIWWFGEDVSIFRYHVGTRGEALGGFAWLAWLVILSFLETGHDYLHLTKRVGIVGGSQLPFHYLLSLKSPYSPLQFLMGTSHESLISIHQILGKIITVLFWCHAALYVAFYIMNSLLAAKIKEFYIICGIFAILGFTAVGTTALKPVRDWSYRVFYITHVSLATVLLPALYFHVHHIRPYIYETVLVYLINVGFRLISTSSHDASIKQVSENLVEISIPLAKGAGRWQPGQHAYVSLQGNPALRTFRSNPFTVASIPPIDGKLRFLARILDGNTAKLVRNAPGSKVSVEGPYGVATHGAALLSYDRVLFVAGGVGATFIVPLYRQLLSDLSPSKGSYRRQKVSFLWIARSMADVSWAVPEDSEREGFTERLTVFLTKDSEGHATTTSDGFAIGGDEEDGAPGEEGIELEERKNLLAEGGDEKSGVHPDGDNATNGLSLRVGRPDLTQAVQDVFTQSSTERVAIVVCGPRGLSRNLRKEVGRWVKRGRDVWFWEEVFGL
ncbi:Ferric/cupric reductase transmembrane component 2 [Pseudocercospora fuligena]|uniref:ferric-chelate reductase (NADPH) n=1 Tax=Pseudocercospora fuligena TaxID=685502 RepID=A0A8H6VEB6_9PEZI|nr:Ferric/cupric reductase transmembrane component 2 [Pseudocercospora fuligena]